MARIRNVEIRNFRGIESLSWFPSEGINCLIGAGDSGKSTLIEAIYRCLAARRNVRFSDADFHRLKVDNEITIAVTIGDLQDRLKNLEAYGEYLRGFDSATNRIEDEPLAGMETVLTLRLTVGNDLEPTWSLHSERAQAQGQTRNISWADRVRLAPTRLDTTSAYHLGWRQGSILNRVSSERADASLEVLQSARQARSAFGDAAHDIVGETLGIVERTARELGIPSGDGFKAMLDTHSVSFGDGTISLHDENEVPLARLGTGSMRLLVSGLQRGATEHSNIILIDEVEHGLEPHRIIRLLHTLGSKDNNNPFQVLMATHSPVVVRELSANQLFVILPRQCTHDITRLDTSNDVQGTVRLFPEACLAASIVVCEGATEVGLLRGLDQYRASIGLHSLHAMGTALVSSDGGDGDRPVKRATALVGIGYRTAVMRDADVPTSAVADSSLLEAGGEIFSCRDGNAIEDELFLALPMAAVEELLACATKWKGERKINDQIKTQSNNHKSLASIIAELDSGSLTHSSRRTLAKAARAGSGWFKTVTRMEHVAREVVGPNLQKSDLKFRELIDRVFAWATKTDV